MHALIGGTGFEEDGILTDCEEVTMETPWGAPSAPLVFGRLGGRRVVFLRRHGVRHEHAPHVIPYRANLWALKHAGAKGVIAVATTGGIGEGFRPGTLAVPDQVIDYTWGREHTYYTSAETGVRHVDFTLPFDEALSRVLVRAAREAGYAVVDGGVYACTQGPRLESAAEVRRYARDGANMIGMTMCPECALARELELPYAGLCVSVNSAAGMGESRRAIHFEELKDDVSRGVSAAVDVVKAALAILEREGW